MGSRFESPAGREAWRVRIGSTPDQIVSAENAESVIPFPNRQQAEQAAENAAHAGSYAVVVSSKKGAVSTFTPAGYGGAEIVDPSEDEAYAMNDALDRAAEHYDAAAELDAILSREIPYTGDDDGESIAEGDPYDETPKVGGVPVAPETIEAATELATSAPEAPVKAPEKLSDSRSAHAKANYLAAAEMAPSEAGRAFWLAKAEAL